MANTHVSNGDAEYAKGGMLTSLGSFKSRRKSVLSRADSEVDDIINLLHGSDPVRVELNRLDNEVRDKDRELADAQAEIKALRYSERLKEKAVGETRHRDKFYKMLAVFEMNFRYANHVNPAFWNHFHAYLLNPKTKTFHKLTDELEKVGEKLKLTEALLETKNLEIKKINDEKRAALAAQFAAEASLRRVHAAQKDDEMPPIEAIITPLEAELKLARQEVAKLQDDNRALDRLTKSKEAALLEAERTVEIALAKASLVDDLQNKNQELMKQIEICQEENKILDKMHRQKVVEVEKLTQTVRELEEAVLAGGAAANAVRDYQRRVQEMNEEKKALDRELARAKVSANRVATVVANEWKDGNDKVMPVKQWLEERKFYQGEMQQLREKLAIAERTTKAEAQMKEKYLLRFKVLEEKLKATSNGNSHTSSEAKGISNGSSRRQSLGGAEALSKLPSNGFSSRRASNLHSGSFRSYGACALLKHAKMSSRSFDGGSRSLVRDKVLTNLSGKANGVTNMNDKLQKYDEILCQDEITNGNPLDKTSIEQEDLVSGMLYDMVQKEVLTLRKACHEKDQSLKDKDDAIEMLAKKVDTLNKAMDVEAKRMRREVASMEKEVAAMRVNKEHEIRGQRLSAPRAAVTRSHSFSARNVRA